MKFNKRKLPKTREEVFKELNMPDDDLSHKVLSTLMEAGIVEYTVKGYLIKKDG